MTMTYEQLTPEMKEFFEELGIEKTPEKVATFAELLKHFGQGVAKQIRDSIDEEYELTEMMNDEGN